MYIQMFKNCLVLLFTSVADFVKPMLKKGRELPGSVNMNVVDSRDVEAVEYFLLRLPAPYKVNRFRVCFQLLSSKCFRFNKNLIVPTASASTFLVDSELNLDFDFHLLQICTVVSRDLHLFMQIMKICFYLSRPAAV